MIIHHNPDDYEVKSTSHICDFHLKNPRLTYSGCTCSGGYLMKRKDGYTLGDSDGTRITAPDNVKGARNSLWDWYAFRDWENIDTDRFTDQQYDVVESSIRAVFGVFCDVLGDHANNGYDACVYCNQDLTVH